MKHAHDLIALLARHRIRVTRPRLEVLQAFSNHDRLTGESIYRLLMPAGSGISMATIYRVLAELARARILDRYSLGRGPSTFALHRDERVLCLTCHRCGRGEECVDEHVSAAFAVVTASRGFVPSGAGVVMYGLCASCAPVSGSAPVA